MRPPLHQPQRGADESQAQYRERRQHSAAVARSIESGPTQSPHVSPLPPNWTLWWLGQHTNPQANLRRKAKRHTSARQLLRHVRAERFYARTAP